MSRIPTDVFERLRYFHEQVEELFRRLFGEELEGDALGEAAAFPNVDVLETEAEMIIRADLPGAERDAIELFGAPGFLVLRGVKPTAREDGGYLRIERTFGPFQRLVVLPALGDPARVRARYDRGVLEVRMDKVVDRRKIHRQIPIE